MEGYDDHPDLQDRRNSVRISFDDEEYVSRAGINKPRVTNLEKLKIGFVTYLKEVDPSLLDCKVEFCYGIEGIVDHELARTAQNYNQ